MKLQFLATLVTCLITTLGRAQDQKRTIAGDEGQLQRAMDDRIERNKKEAQERLRAIEQQIDRKKAQAAQAEANNNGPNWNQGSNANLQMTVLSETSTPMKITQRLNPGKPDFKLVVANTTNRPLRIRAWKQSELEGNRDGNAGGIFNLSPLQVVGLPIFHAERDIIVFAVIP